MTKNNELSLGSASPGLDRGASHEPASLSDRVRSLRLEKSVPLPARRPWFSWLVSLILAGTTGYLAFELYNRSDSPSTKEENKATNPSVSTTASSPVATSGEVLLESKGYIVPVHQIQVSPKVSGLVVKLCFEEGKRVNKGDVLAELEDINYKADRDHAIASMESAKQRWLELKNGNRREEIAASKAELEEAKANREQMYQEHQRNTALKPGIALAAREWEQSEGAFKQADARAERLRWNFRLMELGARIERIAGAKAEYELARAEVAKAEWMLDNCVIRAPISGTILTKKAEEGNLVNSVAFNVSASLCDMADLSDLEVDLNVQEREVAKVFRGQRCRIRPEAFPDRVYEGTVSRLMPIADRSKGAVPVRVKLTVPKDEEGVYLKPEMGAIVSFLKK
jgi:multidrug resistance efflux pump